MFKHSLVVLSAVLISVGECLAEPPAHPLDHLTAAEHWAAYEILQTSDRTGSEMVILSVSLNEPPKSEVLAWRKGDRFRR